MRRLSCVITVVIVVLLTLGLGVAGAQNQSGNEAPLKQSAQQPILQEQPTNEQAPQDQDAQQQGVRTLPIQALTQVSIQDTSFAPAHSTIVPLTSVAWSNQGSQPHTVTADDGSFDSGTLNPGELFLLAFEGQGTLTYHCALHPEMVGSVTVGEGGGSVPPGGSQAPAKLQPSENASESTDVGSGN